MTFDEDATRLEMLPAVGAEDGPAADTPWHWPLQGVHAEQVPQLKTTLPLFAEKVHTLAGAGESGKTWIAAWCVAELARQRQNVLICDGEMSDKAWRLRLLNLGLDDVDLGTVRYTPMSNVGEMRLRFEVGQVDLLVLDSAVTYLARTVRSENDNAEVTRAYDPVIAAARSGPAVLIVDHLARSTNTAVPRGATAKFTSLDVAYGVTLTEGASPNRDTEWSSVITVEKDRDALIGSRRDYAATFTPLGSGNLHLDLAETSTESHRLSMTAADAAYAEVCALDPPPTSGNNVAERVHRTRSLALAAYKRWVNEKGL